VEVVGPQGVVGAAEQAEFDSEGVAIADDRAVEVLVFQGAEEPFDHAVGLRAPDSSEAPPHTVEVGGSAGVIVRVVGSSVP